MPEASPHLVVNSDYHMAAGFAQNVHKHYFGQTLQTGERERVDEVVVSHQVLQQLHLPPPSSNYYVGCLNHTKLQPVLAVKARHGIESLLFRNTEAATLSASAASRFNFRVAITSIAKAKSDSTVGVKVCWRVLYISARSLNENKLQPKSTEGSLKEKYGF